MSGSLTRYFLHMAYDGSDYKGWQVQPEKRTVQETLQHAISTLLEERIEVTGAGRTDTGVHASFFVAHFDTSRPVGPDIGRFIFRLNRFLPDDIVVYGMKQVPDDLHARFSAVYRTYHYHISSVKPLYMRDYVHYLYGSLDVDEINRCCEIIMQCEDFTSFSKLHTDVKTNLCDVMHAEWKEVDSGYLFEIRANRFLRNMVRALVGTLLKVGLGKLDRQGFLEIVEARDRRRAGQSAPAKGLFLVDIGYDGFSF